MIDLLLEYNKWFIVLNKMIYKDVNNQKQVITNPDQIKQLTNNHFQNVTKSKNYSKEFSPKWFK